jgi:hypothetical protein
MLLGALASLVALFGLAVYLEGQLFHGVHRLQVWWMKRRIARIDVATNKVLHQIADRDRRADSLRGELRDLKRYLGEGDALRDRLKRQR